MKNVYSVASGEKQKRLLQRLPLLPYPTTHTSPYTTTPFGDLFEVWARAAMTDLKKKTGASFALLTPKAEKKLFEKLVQDLSSRTAPSFASLLHNAKFERKLVGDTPQNRYLYFIEKIVPNPGYLETVFNRFPCLAQTIASTLLLWIDQAEEFLTRLNRDLQQIEELFSLQKPLGKIVDLNPSLSDLHHGNRSVYQIKFENGLKIIYKPKPLSLDLAFNRFLKKLSIPEGLKTYQVIDRGEYGWAEFIESVPCETEEGLNRFFERLGMLICLTFVLEGTDCHYENLIACEEHPVLIDLESLFHPTIKKTKPHPDLDIWNHSVFRTGFLPGFGPDAKKQIDTSPLSADETQEIPQLAFQWQDVNTDQMQIVFVQKKARISVPRPKYKGQTVLTTPFVPDLLRGFEKMYRYFILHKEEIQIWLEDLFKHPVRCIFRPTRLYSQVLQRLTDPKLKRSEEETNRALEVLSRFSSSKEALGFARIVAVEKEALLHGDIPFFLSSPEDTHLYAGGKIAVSDFFQQSAKEYVIKKIESLNESDLALQLQYIDRSLYFLKKNDIQEIHPAPDLNRDLPILSDEELLLFADRIGEKILSLSQDLSDGTPSWINLEWDPTINRTTFQPISNNFYSGICGIAFFLAHLGHILKKPYFTEKARQLIERLKRPYFEDPEAAKLLMTLGAFTGIGGIIYCFTSLGLDEEALYLASFIEKKKIEQDTAFDIISGSAGLILALLALHEHTQTPSVLDLAKIAGDHLLKNGQPIGEGISWATLQGKFLSGFAHGTAGIAYALLKLYERTKNRAYLVGAEKGFIYEREQYSSKEENWPDLRKENSYSIRSWCYGAPGIALSHLYSLETLPHKEELANALRGTQNHLEGNIDHLCCGAFGKISILWDAGQKLSSPELKKAAPKAAASLLAQFDNTDAFRFFRDLPSQSPGFMQGLAGIGYLLLRMTKAGEHLPEVLVLECR